MLKKIDVLKIAEDFRKSLIQQLACPTEGKATLKLIKKVMDSNDTYNKIMLVAQINVACVGSPRRSNLLKHRLGEETFKKLIRYGLFNAEGHSISSIKNELTLLKENLSASLSKLSNKLDNLEKLDTKT
ncbi:MAG TPA: hypothetical protein DIT25_03235 [Candidatus Moranbacteria bacterium]|nr:hypothetical protein [Candidatus Moranbacteria bacterium]